MTISILGCGWLGLPLAEHLRDQGYTVKGSTTTPEKIELLKDKNIAPFLLELDPHPPLGKNRFWNSDVLIVNIPPRNSGEDNSSFFQQQMLSLADKTASSPISYVLFVSSTSVYPPRSGIVEEKDAVPGEASRKTGNLLLKAEELLMTQPEFDTSVIRFGGLYGYDRHPVRSLAGCSNLKKGSAPINLIHRDDCIGIIESIIDEQPSGEIYNGVCDGHPPRKMYYPAAAEKMSLEPPIFSEDGEEGYKVVSNRKVKQELQYTFKYPNPMDFMSDISRQNTSS